MPPKDYSRQNPRCEQERYSCAMNKNGRCQILHDTRFKRPCPFYKTDAMIQLQLKEVNRWKRQNAV